MSCVFKSCIAISFAACSMYAGEFQCSDAVKAKADEIIGSNVDSGVARWLCENAVLS